VRPDLVVAVGPVVDVEWHGGGAEVMQIGGYAAEAITRHQILPVVDKTFEMGDATAAYEDLAGSRHFGKIAIAVE
jgi:hypothetical protein